MTVPLTTSLAVLCVLVGLVVVCWAMYRCGYADGFSEAKRRALGYAQARAHAGYTEGQP